MTTDRRKQILAVLESVLELPEKERAKYLDEHCSQDPDLRRRVEARLSVDTADSPDGPLLPYNGSDAMIGKHFGPYRIVRELGEGGMGSVYLATRDDGLIEMDVAVKVIRKSLTFGSFRDRFYRERQTMANLKHPHIAMLLDVGESHGHPFIIMECIEGKTIDAWTLANKPNLAVLLQIFRKAAAAIGFAHSKGVIHRDIKPGNLMVTNEGEPKLLDFGIAKLAQPEGDQKTATRAMTPEYASPEQIEGKMASAPSDIYSLGLMLLQLLTGVRPRNMDSSPSDMLNSSEGTTETTTQPNPIQSQSLTAQIDAAAPDHKNMLQHIMRKALAKDSAHRYQSITPLLADLDRLIPHLPNSIQADTPKQYDVVIWAHPQLIEMSTLLAQHLEKAGLKLWRESDPTGAGTNPEAIDALASAHTCVVCAGTEQQQPWHDFAAFNDSLGFLAKQIHIVPVLAPNAPWPEKQSKLPAFLRDKPWITFPAGFTSSALARFEAAVRNQDLDRPTLQLGVCPFRGLEVFREQDQHFFFGREAVVQNILAHMRKNTFMSVLGPSGSGKSSVVQAGVLPEMRNTGSSAALFTPGGRPIDELAFALHCLFEDLSGSPNIQEITTRLKSGPEALHLICLEMMAASAGRRAFLVIDQFEELFTLAGDPQQREAFVGNICHAVSREHGALQVLITMRSDFLGHCASWPDLNKFVIDHALQVEPMSQTNLVRAVTVPAQLAGLKLEHGLLERMLDDIAESGAELPLIEHALLELYDRRDGALLTLTAYDAIGGIEGALAKRAEAEYLALDHSNRMILRKMFTLCLIHPGDGAQDTRRRATRDELDTMGPDNAVTQLLDQWVGRRLLTSAHDRIRNLVTITLSHEALIRMWPRIADWMAEDREMARLLNRLRRDARAWDDAHRIDDLLPRGALLLQMSELIEQKQMRTDQLESAFLSAATDLAQREARARQAAAETLRRQRNRAQFAGAAALLLAVAAFVLFFRADQAKVAATTSEQEAVRARDLAQQRTREGNYNLSLAYNERAAQAKKDGNPQAAWIYSLAALTLDTPRDIDLDEPRGRLVELSIELEDRLLWSSPIIPKLQQVAVSPDGHRAALVDEVGRVRLLNLETGVQIGMVPGRLIARQLAFSTAGNSLILASGRGGLHLYDLDSDTVIDLLPFGLPEIAQLAVSPDGANVATVRADGLFRLVSLPEGHIIQERQGLNPNSKPVYLGTERVAVSGDRSLIVIEINSPNTERFISTNVSNPVQGITHYRNGLAVFGINQIQIFDDALNPKPILQLTQPITRLVGAEDESWLIASTQDTSLAIINPDTGQFSPLTPSHQKMENFQITQGILSGCDETGNLIRLELESLKIADSLFGHGGDLVKIAFSSGDEGLSAVSSEGRIINWSLNPVLDSRVEKNLNRRLHMAAYHAPDNRWALGFEIQGKPEAEIHLYKDIADKPQIFPVSTNLIHHLAFSPDGRWFAASLSDQIKLWDLTQPGEPRIWQGNHDFGADFGPILKLSFSPDSRKLAHTTPQRSIRYWNLFGDFENQIFQRHHNFFSILQHDPKDGSLAASSWGAGLYWWKKDQPPLIIDHKFNSFNVIDTFGAFSFSPTNSQMLIPQNDFSIHVWDLNKQETESQLFGHSSSVNRLAYSADGSMAATGSVDGSIRIWNTIREKKADQTFSFEHQILTIALSPSGTMLALSLADGSIKIINTQTGQLVNSFKGHMGGVYSLEFSGESNLLTASGDFMIKIRDIASGEHIFEYQGDTTLIKATLSPDGRRLFVAATEHAAQIWDLSNSNTPEIMSTQGQYALNAAFSSDSSQIFFSTIDHKNILLDLESYCQPFLFEGHGSIVSVAAFSLNNRQLATGSYDHSLILWDTFSGEMQRRLPHDSSIWQIAYSPNDDRLYTLTERGRVTIWDPKSGRRLLSFDGQPKDARSKMEFSADFSKMALLTDANTVALHNPNMFPIVPEGEDEREWAQDLLDRSLYHMGYRLDGFKLYPWPRIRLQGVNRVLKPSTYDHLDKPRPRGVNYVDWLQNGTTGR